MSSVSRQDIQIMLDQMRVRLQDQLASKQDVQRSSDAVRDRVISYMHDYLQQNQQQFIRQLDDRTKMYKSQISSLENRLQLLEQEVRISYQVIQSMAHKQRNIVIPSVQEVAQQNGYRYAQEG